MKFTVIYRPSAENQLIDLWTQGPDRQEITRAADEFEVRLRKDPQNEGESRSETTRILFIHPLAVLFEVSEPDCMVFVLKIWRINLPN
jgi:hypothetical protein